MRTRTTLHLRTVTPAFIGSAELERAEWNGKAIRGELRWWVRALAGGEMNGDADRVRDLERQIFGGGAEGKDDQREEDRSSALRVLVHVARAELADAKEDPPRPALDESALAREWGNSSDPVHRRLRLSGRTNPIGYLGYGPIEHDKDAGGVVYKRGWIPPKSDLTLILQWNAEISPTTKELFERALWCWINLGGIGARSRRGFGSLVRTDTAGVVADERAFKQGVVNNLRAACNPLSNGPLAAWSHFSADAHVYRSTKVYAEWNEAMKVAGAWMIAFRRRYGKSDDERTSVRGRDYEWLKSQAPPGGVPDRAGFGLPLPFGRNNSVAWGNREGRRASPLLIHIAEFEPKKYYVIFTHIPAQLVPDDAKIGFRGKSSAPTADQQKIVHDFLDDLKTKQLVEELL